MKSEEGEQKEATFTDFTFYKDLLCSEKIQAKGKFLL